MTFHQVNSGTGAFESAQVFRLVDVVLYHLWSKYYIIITTYEFMRYSVYIGNHFSI